VSIPGLSVESEAIQQQQKQTKEMKPEETSVRRRWTFDRNFLNPAKLPPGTPMVGIISAD